MSTILGPERAQDPQDAVGAEFRTGGSVITRFEMVLHPRVEQTRGYVRARDKISVSCRRLSSWPNSVVPVAMEVVAI